VTLISAAYTAGEDFRATIRNASATALKFTWLRIERRHSENWQLVRRMTNCPCSALCKLGPDPLLPGEIRTMTWDRNDDSCTEIGEGVYRAVFVENGKVLATSPQFEVR